MEFHNICRKYNNEPPVFDNSAKNCSMHEFVVEYPAKLEKYD